MHLVLLTACTSASGVPDAGADGAISGGGTSGSSALDGGGGGGTSGIGGGAGGAIDGGMDGGGAGDSGAGPECKTKDDCSVEPESACSARTTLEESNELEID